MIYILTTFINALNFMVPILLASIGEILTERSGIVNIGIEGILNLSAFTSAVAAFTTGNPFLGFVVGIATGALLGLVHGVLSTYLRGDQIIIGIGVNIVSYSIGVLGLIALWKQHGASPRIPSLPLISISEGLSISLLALVSPILAIAVWWFLTKTDIGLKIRACGEDPRAAEAMGIKVFRMQVMATVLGAMLSGVAGSYLVLGIVSQFVRGIAAGRGFIALANVAFSGWNPLIAILGAYIFGFLDALAISLQIAIGAIALAYPLRMIPYIGTLAIVSMFRWRARAPRYLGKPYIKE
ncbi:MAG TPA: ABC transporter permease [Ignisphaera aggregans]|uniref:ABC transporter permease n=1 Tax=Ignisphaera aggregans TaxID=334771 RepID=A0A833DTC4_9CREN|nr:ABC transporter permease [Ignisphaera aggregans]